MGRDTLVTKCFEDYFEEHNELITLEKLLGLVRKKYGKQSKYSNRTFVLAKKVYLNRLVFPKIEEVLKESGEIMGYVEIFDSIPELKEDESILRTSLVYHARELDNDVVVIVDERGKNKYLYDPECAGYQRKNRKKTKRYCGQYRCGTYECLKHNP